MRNINRAAEIIATKIDSTILGIAIARLLKDKGLLAPDLPAPSVRSIMGYHKTHPWAEWGDNAVIYSSGSIDANVHYDMDPSEARELAAYLLAAAEHMEKNQ